MNKVRTKTFGLKLTLADLSRVRHAVWMQKGFHQDNPLPEHQREFKQCNRLEKYLHKAHQKLFHKIFPPGKYPFCKQAGKIPKNHKP